MKASAFVFLLGALLMRPTSCEAQVGLLWDTSVASGVQGGTGNWLGTINWNNVLPGNNVAWEQGRLAVFNSTPGTVTVNGAVTAGGLIFNVNGYTVGGASTITLNGAPSNINVSNAGQSATISAPLGGSAGFTKIGAGTLTLSGSAANSYTGLATVTDGTLNLSKSGVNALTGNLTIGDGTGAAGSRIVTQGANNQIPDTATVRIEQDGFWNLASGNRSETIGGLELGESSIATGTGTLTLNGNVSTFFPGFDGDLRDASISGFVDLGGATRTFTVVSHTDLVVSGAISNGALTKAGTRMLKLSGTTANSYFGVTTVTDGELQLDKPAGVNAIGGDLVVTGLGARVSQVASEQIRDTATVTIGDRGSWGFISGNHSETVAALTFTSGNIGTGSGTLTVNGNITANASSDIAGISGQLDLGGATRVFDVALGTAPLSDLTVLAVISNGGLTKTGSGRLSLTGPSTFTGPVSINGGVVRLFVVSNNGLIGPLGAGNSISFDGGTLSVIGESSSATDRAVTLNSGGGVIDITDAVTTVTMTGAITGAGGLMKTGPNTLSLGGTMSNSYAGTTTTAAGTLNLNKSAGVNAIGGNLAIGDGSGAAASAIVTQGADGQIPDAATVAVAADGLWNLASGNRSETIAALTMAAGSIATGGGTLTVNGNVTTNANAVSGSISGHLNLGGVTRSFDIAEGTAAFDLDISAALSNGAGGLTKTGDGTLRLNGVNTFNGPVTISAGTLIARNGSAIGDSSDVTVANGATLTVEGDEAIGSLAGGGSVILGTGATLTVRGGSATFSGSISGAGSLAKSDAGTLTFSATPMYTGNTLITAGTLVLNNGIASAPGSLTVNAAGTLQARSTVNRAIAGDGTITATGTLVIGDASSAAGFAFDGTLNVGSNSITLADADVAQLGVATTLGNGGRLDALNGSLLASGRSVTSGAAVNASISASFTNNGVVHGPTTSGRSLTFLGDVNGAGNYTGNVTFSDGFSPGMSTAAVSLENFTLDATATLNIEIGGLAAGTQHDRLNFTGAGMLGGELSVSLVNGFTPKPGNTFTILQGGTLSGAFAATTLPPLGPDLAWQYSQSASAVTLKVVSTAPVVLRVVAIARLPNGHIQLTCLGAPGEINRVETVASLIPTPTGWVTTASITADENGNFTFTDTNAPTFPARFYRLAFP